ncbi:hypothetical protein HY025_06130 [Candidatus Daviesbacteria bacterium]|nr:hypothetical protein [Candidatus Daviesbacteria bacterium]
MIKHSKVIVGNTDLLTAQAFIYPSPNLNLAILVSCEGEDVFTKVRFAISDTETKFFEMEEAISVRIEETLKFLKTELASFENLQILLAAWQENILYIKRKGSHQAYIYRDNELIILTPEASLEESENNQLISGYLKKGDLLLFITDNFDKYLKVSSPENSSQVISQLITTPTEDFEEEVNSIWQQGAMSSPTQPVPTASETSPQTENQLVNIDPLKETGEETVTINKEEPVAENDQTESQPEPDFSDQRGPIAAILVNYHSDEIEFSRPQPVAETQSQIIQTRQFRLPSLGLKIPQFSLRSRRLRFFVILLVLILLIVGGFLAFENRQLGLQNSNFSNLLSDAKDKYHQALNLKDLDPNAAKQNLDEASKKLNEALAIKPNDTDAQNLKKQIESDSSSILKIFEIKDFPVFLSLDLVKKDFSAKKMSMSLNKILLLDETKKTLVLIDLETKTNQILAGADQLGDGQFASLNGDFGFVYSKDKGILRVDTKLQKTTNSIKPDSEWGKINDIYGFGGNIYLLDILKNQIWKYLPIASGYSDKISYFKDAKNDLADSKRMEIDSSVWLLKSGNEIKKFTSGALDNFSLSGLDKPLADLTNFFISDQTDNIYLLDSGNSRLVVTSKTGQYKDQYHGDKFKTASDLVVDEKGKKIYLLENNQIYQIELKS